MVKPIIIKTSLLFIFPLILIGSVSFGQLPYHPFPVKNAEWSEVEGANIDASFNYEGKLYALASDTIINGISYSLIGYNLLWYSDAPTNSVNFSYTLPGSIIAAEREDSSRKIWIRFLDSSVLSTLKSYYPTDTFSLNKDIILYDFSLKKGDTVQWMPKLGLQDYNIVLGIDSVQLSNGEWRNEIKIGLDSWIEGIGSIRGLLGPYKGLNPEGGAYNLRCFTTDTVTYNFDVYNDWLVINCTWVYDGIDKINSSSFSIYPNPADSKIYLTTSQNTYNEFVEIDDISGRIVLRQSVPNQVIETTLNVSSLEDGFYIVNVKAKNGNTLFTNKLLIIR